MFTDSVIQSFIAERCEKDQSFFTDKSSLMKEGKAASNFSGNYVVLN